MKAVRNTGAAFGFTAFCIVRMSGSCNFIKPLCYTDIPCILTKNYIFPWYFVTFLSVVLFNS